jgi:hypothetical protein
LAKAGRRLGSPRRWLPVFDTHYQSQDDDPQRSVSETDVRLLELLYQLEVDQLSIGFRPIREPLAWSHRQQQPRTPLLLRRGEVLWAWQVTVGVLRERRHGTADRLGVKDIPGITVGCVVSTGQKFI